MSDKVAKVADHVNHSCGQGLVGSHQHGHAEIHVDLEHGWVDVQEQVVDKDRW
jgi:hypothetical protein